MENTVNFNIRQESFSIVSLIDKNIDDFEIQRLIQAVTRIDQKLKVHEPFASSIRTPHDNWRCYESENLGLSFEFIESTLCYISFESKWKEIIKTGVLKDIHLIVGVIQNEQGQINTISFGSKSLIIGKGLYPNRLSFIIESFFDSPLII